MRTSLLLVLLSVLAISFVLATPRIPTVRHAYGAKSAWKNIGQTNGDNLVKVSFYIKQQNLHLLDSVFNSVSDPKSPLYGKYLTIKELSAMTSTPASTQAVADWLKKHNAKSIDITQSGDWIRAMLPASAIECHFNTKVYDFVSHKNPDRKITRVNSYTIPAELVDHVAMVGHMDHFPAVVRRSFLRESAKRPMDSQGNTDPATLFAAYSISGNTVATTKSTQGVFEDDLQSVDPSDISSFQTQFNLPQQALATITGPNDPTSCASNPDNCVESLLDTEWMMAVAQNSPTTFYGIDENDPTPFIDWLIDLGNDANAPWVNSVSYGEDELQVPSTTTSTFNTEIQKIGARGISIMVSSGDDGANGEGARNNVPAGCGFAPSYPASSPFVTAVGATQGPETSTPEVGCSSSTNGLITSGGGFSTVWSVPSYQSDVVSSYLAQSNSSTNGEMPPTSAYAAGGRGYPDVAILGHNYYITAGGQSLIVSGTSASSPVFAAMITLANGKRMAAGKATLGFLNPALYQIAASDPSVFNDITSGWSNCPASQSVPPACCQFGWPATAGWDAMTGLGSVNFPKLMAALLAL